MLKTLALSLCMLITPVVFAAAADSTAPVPAPPAPKHLLQYKFKLGETVRWKVEHRATVDSTIQGTTQTAETRTTSVKLWTVLGVDKGVTTFEHSVESIDMWQQMKGRQEVRYNSLTDKTPPAGYEHAAKAVGVVLTMASVDAQGKVVRRKDSHNSPDSNSTPLCVLLPAEAISIGDVWHSPAEVDVKNKAGGVIKIKIRQQYTLQQVAAGKATIGVETQILSPVHDPAIEAQLIQRLTTGTIHFDMEAGRVIDQQIDLDRRVIGFSGPSSSMHYLSQFTEQLMPASPQTAKAPTPTATQPAQPAPAVSSAAPAVKQPALAPSRQITRTPVTAKSPQQPVKR